MLARMRINWVILRTSIEERLVYRGDFAFATLIRFLPIVTQIFLWGAIYRGTEQAGGTAGGAIKSYTYASMVGYYLLTMIARAFSSMPGLATGIARDVREGTVKKYLTQPIDMLGYLFWHRVAHKLVYYVVAAAPFALVFYVCRGYFEGRPDAIQWSAFAASLVLAFLIGFLMESLLGMIAFWFLDIGSLVFVYMMLNYFLSGHMIPFEWFPDWLASIVQFLPFKYLAYVPATILLEAPDGTPRYTHAELGTEIAAAVGWMLVLLLLNRLAFARGVKRYSAFGG